MSVFSNGAKPHETPFRLAIPFGQHVLKIQNFAPLLLLLLTAALSIAQDATIPVCPLETTDEAQLTWGQYVTAKRIEVNADPKFISEGKASLHLSGRSEQAKGNKYLGVRFPIPKSDMDSRFILFDAWSTNPATTQAVYFRLYDSTGKMAGSWNNWSSPFADSHRRIFHLNPAIPKDGFHYEEKNVTGNPLTDIAAVEIVIGTRDDNVPFDIYFDNLRMSAQTVKTFADIKSPKKLFLKTCLVEDGRPNALIVAPAQPALLGLARKISDRIKALTGAELPVRLEETFVRDEAQSTNTILLGNINNNRWMIPLYGLRYTWVDDAYPGGDGYVIKTVHDPWGTGRNAIILGGSSEAGVEKAADEFLSMLKDGKDLILDRIHRVAPGSEEVERLHSKKLDEKYIEQTMDNARRALATGAHKGITGHVSNAGLAYGRTGDETYAMLFKKLVYLMYEHRLTNPKTYGGPWGMDADFSLHTIIPAWDVVEESPVFSDEDRLKITRILFEFSDYCMPKARSCLTSKRVRHNHQTFPALGLFHAGTYFKKYYGLVEADYWLQIAEAAFGLQAKAAKPLEDCNGYQWLTLYHLMQYALAKPDWTYFENGNARRGADYAILCMDNIGYQVPYGDTGSYRCWQSEVPFLRGANWYYKDGRYQWAIDRKRSIWKQYPLGEYIRNIAPVEPVDLIGVKALPLDPLYYETWDGPDHLPIEKTVDKVVMRASFDPQRQYLLLDGLSNGGHKHYDGNSICRITDRGRIWLADDDYIKALPKYHNGVLIYRDGQSETIPPFCELEAVADFDDIGFSETVVRNYAGVDWHRNIIWLKEKYFLVADEMVAREESPYTFNCKWHLVGQPTLKENSLMVEQQGKRFFVSALPGLQLKLSDDHELGANWRGYEFAEPIVRVFEEIARVHLGKGEQFTYFNVLHSSDSDQPLEFTTTPASEKAVLVQGSGESALAGTAEPGSSEKFANIEIMASAYRIAPDGFALANALLLRCRGKVLFQSAKPVSIHCARNETVVIASEAAQIEIAIGDKAPGKIVLDPGRTRIEGCPDIAEIAEEIASLMKAPPVVASKSLPPPAAEGLPSLKQLWKYQEEIPEVLLSTRDPHHPRAWRSDVAIRCDPAPLSANIFSGKAENKVENLLDGKISATENCAMWDADQSVTIVIDLKDECDITRVALRAWWADSSSKGNIFQLDRAVIEASSDGFADDIRPIGEIVDQEAHENWGGKEHLPETYELKDIKASASQVRLRLSPRKGTGIYLAELEVWGKKKGVPLSPETLAARGIEFTKLACAAAADLNGDGRDEVILGASDGKVLCLGADGKPLWQVKAEEKVTCVCVANLNKDGASPASARHVIAGSEDEKVYAIDASGKIAWKFEVPRYKQKGCVRTVFPARLNGGSAEQIIAGVDGWRYYAIDERGAEIWRYESVRVATVGLASDLDNDGKDEVLMGTVYYWWSCVNPDGTKKWSYHPLTGPIATSLTAGNIVGDDRKEVVFGGADSNLHVVSPDGKLLWQFNTADAVTAVKTLDMDGDGKDEIIASAVSANVYAIKGDGKAIWRCEPPGVVNDLTLLDSDGDGKMEVAAACGDGSVYLLSLEGKLIAGFRAGAAVEKIVAANLEGDAKRSLIALCADGSARAISR